MMDIKKIKTLTFDCYGTLVDWENGILQALRPLLQAHGIRQSDAQLLDLYAQLESQAEEGEFKNYKTILRSVVQGIGEESGFRPTGEELDCLAKSIPNWQAFPDTVKALKELKKHFKLAILSNIDDDLIVHSLKHLKVEFDWVITAQQVKSYKPSPNNFQQMIRRVGMPKEKILHVAQSIYHDIVPAKKAGLAAIWINRRKNIGGFGAAPPAYAEPDFEVPDLRSLAAYLLGKSHS